MTAPPSNPITTTGLSTTVTTTQGTNETVPKWIDRHDSAVASGTPNGNTLSTNYLSGSGPQTVSTTRKAGESDNEFLLRHRSEYLLAMIAYPPVS